MFKSLSFSRKPKLHSRVEVLVTLLQSPERWSYDQKTLQEDGFYDSAIVGPEDIRLLTFISRERDGVHVRIGSDEMHLSHYEQDVLFAAVYKWIKWRRAEADEAARMEQRAVKDRIDATLNRALNGG